MKFPYYIKKYPKINIVTFCYECLQGYICIVKNSVSEKLYCQCMETGLLYATPQDVFIMNSLNDAGFYGEDQEYVLASKDEIQNSGWNIPENKICLCRECSLMRTEYWVKTGKLPTNQVPYGMVVIKKDLDTKRLFCRCAECGSVWLSIESALAVVDFDDGSAMSHPYETAKKRRISPDNIIIPNYCDAMREEIVNAGW